MRHLFFLFLLLFFPKAVVLSQTVNMVTQDKVKAKVLEKKDPNNKAIESITAEKNNSPSEENSNIIKSTSPTLKKSVFPKNQKVGPAIFYVKNDQPIDQNQYMVDLKNAAEKNKKP